MGADFCWAAAPAPIDQHGELLTTTEKGGVITQIAERLQSTPFIENYVVDFLGYQQEEETDATPLDYAAEQVALFIDDWKLSRELGSGTFGSDRLWIVTGGMTWGDNPTDAFSVVSFIEATGIFEEPFTTPLYRPDAEIPLPR